MKSRQTTLLLFFLVLLIGCARMGNTLPDGGWYDEDPPKVLGSTPDNGGVNITEKNIRIYFDEYVKIENATENVIISPPQIEQPEIKTKGKSIVVELKDTLKENTTYTIDFSDAIVDNNEANPLGNYTFTFSTGTEIDTMQVSGYVLDSETLEPMAGIQVGLYSVEDSVPDADEKLFMGGIFTKKPFLRVSRTDQAGHFSIKGIKPGSYNVYALKDVDNNFFLTPGTGETLAYTERIITPSVFDDYRQDTIWLDSLRIKDIKRIKYKHYVPDDIVLRTFAPIRTDRAFLKSDRSEADHFSLFFTYGDSIMPEVKGLNFDSTEAFVIETNEKRDTINYWLRDTMLVNTDTLLVEMSYRATDTLGNLETTVDTLQLLPKLSYEKRKREENNVFEQWMKKQNKLKKRGEPYDSIMPPNPLEVTYKVESKTDPDKNPYFTFKKPLELLDTAKIHLYYEKDSLWYETKFSLKEKENMFRTVEMIVDWQLDTKYSLEIDSAAFVDIYGNASKPYKSGIQVKKSEDYGTFKFVAPELKGKNVIYQLLENGEKIVKQIISDQGEAKFVYLSEKVYYLRMIIDSNANGEWDTGDFFENIQPEEVFYYPKEIKCRAKWDISEIWNPSAVPLFEQKPSALRKSKSGNQSKKRTESNKNLRRAELLGIEYPFGK